MDLNYIHNITENLSYIIYKAYDEEHGEIAQGRVFGSKGEHMAADILYENMTKLGLNPIKEQLKPRFPGDYITSKMEILDYYLKVNNETVDCFPRGITLNLTEKKSQEIYTFSYEGLKVKREHPTPENDTEDYVLIHKTFIPDFTFSGERILSYLLNLTKKIFNLNNKNDDVPHPHYKGTLNYDFLTNDTHDSEANERSVFTFFINKSVGEMINTSVDDFTVDFSVKERYNRSVESYNVIGQLNGTDPTKTIIVCCLYDGWWNQATADSAIGMAVVLGIAKYFVDHKIQPRYNIKFIGFCGEEQGGLGSIYYETTHRREKIIYVIDLNQIGFKQDSPRLRLEVASNNKNLLEKIWKVVERTDYTNRTGNTTDIVKILSTAGHLSDDRTFALRRPLRCKTVCILKNGEWDRHHRDGLNHTEGDSMKYFDWNDVSVTGEMVWNVTECLAVDSP